MSLQVWLPLTKDLRQQGLSNVTVTNNGATFNSAGKLGGCYSFNRSSSNYLKIDNPITTATNGVSMAFWVKIPSNASGNNQIVHIGNGAGWNNNRCTCFIYYGSSSLIFSCSDGQGTSTANSTQYSCKSSALTLNSWTHVVCTYGTGKMKIYLNGVLDKDYTTTIIPSFTNTSYIGVGAAPDAGEPATVYVNDVRIYDHCLSPMEVKELAKGLVLHYPLNRQGWGQENLMRNTYRADGNNSNQVYGWMANGNGNPEIVTKDGNECIHLQASCTGAYTPSIVSASKLLLENGVDYIVSCDLMYDKEIKVQNTTPVHYHNGSTSSTDPFNLTNVNNGKGFVWKSVKPVANTIIPANTWQHYEMRLTAVATPTDSSLPYSTYRAFIYGAVRTTSETATVNMWLKNWKIEKGTIATPWCPNSSDTLAITMGLNSTTEYDCSGFCNNGTRMGTFTWTSDTPKYQVSTKFSQSRIQCNGDFLYGLSTATLSAWVKLTAYHSERCMVVYANGRYLTINNNGQLSGYSYGKTPAGYYNSSQTIPLNTWTHITIVWDDTTWYFYINGVLVNSWACTGTFTNVGSYASVGQESNGGRSVSGLISDARVYATALSADDVKSLYQNSAYIDSSGNVYGAVHSEV